MQYRYIMNPSIDNRWVGTEVFAQSSQYRVEFK